MLGNPEYGELVLELKLKEECKNDSYKAVLMTIDETVVSDPVKTWNGTLEQVKPRFLAYVQQLRYVAMD